MTAFGQSVEAGRTPRVSRWDDPNLDATRDADAEMQGEGMVAVLIIALPFAMAAEAYLRAKQVAERAVTRGRKLSGDLVFVASYLGLSLRPPRH